MGLAGVLSAFTVAVSGGLPIAGSVAFAADGTESHAQRAERLRRQSEARAKSRLGYESVGRPDDPDNLHVGIEDIGALISRLGETIRRLEAERRSASSPMPPIPGLPGGTEDGDFVSRAYGPEGPTVASVRAMLTYRLVTLGNPNLMAGEVVDRGDHVVATVVTRDKSLVARYVIDKKSGRWHQATAR